MPKIKVVGQTVQTGELGHTSKQTHGRYQTHYLPCFAVDNNGFTFALITNKSYSIPHLDGHWSYRHGGSSWITYFDWAFTFGFQEYDLKGADPTHAIRYMT